MHFTKLAALTLSAVSSVAATNFHNDFGHSGFVQDFIGNEYYIGNGGTVGLSGGWAFFWVDADVCPGKANSAAYSWPTSFGDVYLRSDGRLYESGGSLIYSETKLC